MQTHSSVLVPSYRQALKVYALSVEFRGFRACMLVDPLTKTQISSIKNTGQTSKLITEFQNHKIASDFALCQKEITGIVFRNT